MYSYWTESNITSVKLEQEGYRFAFVEPPRMVTQIHEVVVDASSLDKDRGLFG